MLAAVNGTCAVTLKSSCGVPAPGVWGPLAGLSKAPPAAKTNLPPHVQRAGTCRIERRRNHERAGHDVEEGRVAVKVDVGRRNAAGGPHALANVGRIDLDGVRIVGAS